MKIFFIIQTSEFWQQIYDIIFHVKKAFHLFGERVLSSLSLRPFMKTV